MISDNAFVVFSIPLALMRARARQKRQLGPRNSRFKKNYFSLPVLLLLKYTEQERQLICPEGVRVQAVFQQPELRGMSARARPRVTLRMVLVLFAGLLFSLLWISKCMRPPLLRSSSRILLRPAQPLLTPGSP